MRHTQEETKACTYKLNGYKSRKDYLKSLSENMGVPLSAVLAAASMLGPNEDFDGLVASMEDLAEFCG